MIFPVWPGRRVRSAKPAAAFRRVLRSFSPWKIQPWRAAQRVRWGGPPHDGVTEVYDTVAKAIRGARRYIYLEDQYFHEAPGGDGRHQLYRDLRDAAARQVRIILLGSGPSDPAADGGRGGSVGSTVTRDLQRKILNRLAPADRTNVVLHRVRGLTVYSKLILIDDVFACIGSANFYSRSMVGTDSELSCAMVTTGTAVRDLRVRLWAEHLRTDVDHRVLAALRDLGLAMGIWRPEWLPATAPAGTWQSPGRPAGYAPTERALLRVQP